MLDKLVEISEILDSLARSGWMLRGIPACLSETVSQHSYRVALLTLGLAAKLSSKGVNVDVGRAVLLALIHDIAEAYIGDITPMFKGYSVKEPAELEAVIERIGIETITRLFREYQEQKSVEALIVKLADQLATLSKAYRYSAIGYNVDDIIENTEEKIRVLASKIGLNWEALINEIYPQGTMNHQDVRGRSTR